MEANWSDPEYVRGRSRRKTIWIVGFVLHLALFAGLIGWPYVRGEMRGRDSRRAFGAFAACFYGGEATGEAGLSLPAGDRLAYAGLFLSADPEWPGRCRPLLTQLIDGEPFLLYPGVKGAEAQVREVALLADAELVSLEEARATPGGRIPLEPLEAVGRVAGSLADLARAIDPLTPIEGEVIRLDGSSLPDPARVPVTTASDAVIDIDARADGIRVRAVDTRGLSRSRSQAGRSRAGRVRRPSTARAMLAGAGDDPFVVYATNPSRCIDDPHRCSRRSTGIATWVFGDGVSEPVWLSGHPRGRIDRVVRVADAEVSMIVVGPEGEGAELRLFTLPGLEAGTETDPDPDPQTTPAMIAPERRIDLDGVTSKDDVLLTPHFALYSATDASGEVRFYSRAPSAGAPALVAELSGEQPFILACADRPFFAFGTSAAVVIAEAGAAGPVVGHRREITLWASPFDARRPSRDRVRLVCDDTGASLMLQHEDDLLELVSCARGGVCDASVTVAEEAAGFDVVRTDGATVVTWFQNEDDGALHAATFGQTSVPARIIAACFADGEGLCGHPRMDEQNGRVLVAAQEGADLRVLESTDRGQTFRRMTGVR